jgi:hypothetical protein
MFKRLRQRIRDCFWGIIDLGNKYGTVINMPQSLPGASRYVALYFSLPEEEDSLKLARRGGDYLFALQAVANWLRSVRKYEDITAFDPVIIRKKKFTKKQIDFIIDIIDQAETKFYNIVADEYGIDLHGEVT